MNPQLDRSETSLKITVFFRNFLIISLAKEIII